MIKWLYRLICIIWIGAGIEGSYMYLLPFDEPVIKGIWIAGFILINILPALYSFFLKTKTLKRLADGVELLVIFVCGLIVAAFFEFTTLIPNLIATEPWDWDPFIKTNLRYIIILSIVFWGGIIRVYLNSLQLGIRYRVWGIILGWLFPANLVMLCKIINVTGKEVKFENKKIIVNEKRKDKQICALKYPILMVHGVFFRDFKAGFLNYWGRIPGELIQNGAKIYYGSQQSAAAVEECGKELAERIKQIVKETGCEKVNIIAHSKGGLDSRAAIARYGVEDMVASLTTINTPHRGCEFADYLLGKIGQGVKDVVALTYNTALKKLGDQDPNFIEAVTDLTHENCGKFNEITPDSEKVYYQSVGSAMPKASGGRFPLNYSYHLVKMFDGKNDGLVGEKSFEWGSKYTFLEPKTNRGISHGDMIDLNRENIDGFDVREFFVQLVAELKEKGF